MTTSDPELIKEGRSKHVISTVIVLLLIVIVGIQTWYIVDIKKQLETIQNGRDSTLVTASKTIEQANAETATVSNLTEHDNTAAHDEPSTADKTDLSPENTTALDMDHPPTTSYRSPARDPYAEFHRMQQHFMRQQMERSFDSPYRRHQRQDFQYNFRQHVSIPEIDVKEDTEKYIIFVNVPGAKESDVAVKMDGQRLFIRGKHVYQKQGSDPSGRISFSESRSGNFQRSIKLTEPVDQKGLRTKIDNGVLTIIIPKRI